MIYQANFHFYGSLNRFLSPTHRHAAFDFQFEAPRSIKDIFEALGVPHTEVAVLLVNGKPVDFGYHVQDQDQISLYPTSESPESGPIQPIPAGEARFVADVHLGRLAAYLRMLGFDTLYPDDYRDEELARLSSVERRILLTRDRGLLKRSVVTQGYYVHEIKPWQQLAEVLQRFDLFDAVASFHRCTQCNGLLKVVSKEAVADKLMPNTRAYYTDFRQCQSCGKVYWKGSHYEAMEQFLERLMNERRAAALRTSHSPSDETIDDSADERSGGGADD